MDRAAAVAAAIEAHGGESSDSRERFLELAEIEGDPKEVAPYSLRGSLASARA